MENLLRVSFEFFTQFSWMTFPPEEPFEIRNLITGEHRVVQIHGATMKDVGVALWKSVDDFRAYVCPGVTRQQAMINGGVVTFFYETEDLLTSDDLKEAYKSLGIQKMFVLRKKQAISYYHPKDVYSNMKVHGSDSTVTDNDILFLTAILTFFPDFSTHHMSRKPYELFKPVTWKPINKKYELSDAQTGKEPIPFEFRYPAEGQTIPRGAHRVEGLPSYVGKYTADTLEGVANEFLARLEVCKRELAPEVLANPDIHQTSPEYLSTLRGLCEVFWELGTYILGMGTAETLYKCLVPFYEVNRDKNILLRFYLELEQWDKIPPLLATMNPKEPEMLWIGTLFNFRRFGADSAQANKTLDQALITFEDAMLLILGQRSLNEKEFDEYGEGSTIMFMTAGHGFSVHASSSGRFCKYFARFWRRNANAWNWLAHHGIKRLQALQRAKSRNEIPLEFPKPRLPVCGFCMQLKDEMPKCSRCHVTRYCNAVCQKAHWKTHKKDCLPPNAKDRQDLITKMLNGEVEPFNFFR